MEIMFTGISIMPGEGGSAGSLSEDPQEFLRALNDATAAYLPGTTPKDVKALEVSVSDIPVGEGTDVLQEEDTVLTMLQALTGETSEEMMGAQAAVDEMEAVAEIEPEKKQVVAEEVVEDAVGIGMTLSPQEPPEIAAATLTEAMTAEQVQDMESAEPRQAVNLDSGEENTLFVKDGGTDIDSIAANILSQEARGESSSPGEENTLFVKDGGTDIDSIAANILSQEARGESSSGSIDSSGSTDRDSLAVNILLEEDSGSDEDSLAEKALGKSEVAPKTNHGTMVSSERSRRGDIPGMEKSVAAKEKGTGPRVPLGEGQQEPFMAGPGPTFESGNGKVIMPPGLTSKVMEPILNELQVQRMSLHDEVGEIRIRLKPESLGEVFIKITQDEGGVTGRILVENLMVKEVLESRLALLKERLTEMDVDVKEIQVSLGSTPEKGNGAGSPMRQAWGPWRGRGQEMEPAMVSSSARITRGGLDIFA